MARKKQKQDQLEIPIRPPNVGLEAGNGGAKRINHNSTACMHERSETISRLDSRPKLRYLRMFVSSSCFPVYDFVFILTRLRVIGIFFQTCSGFLGVDLRPPLRNDFKLIFM